MKGMVCRGPLLPAVVFLVGSALSFLSLPAVAETPTARQARKDSEESGQKTKPRHRGHAQHAIPRRPAAQVQAHWPEAVEMLFAILNGSRMGPGEGWFHPGQSRYDWNWLARHCGLPVDQSIRLKNFSGSPALFDRLDRDGDGVITAEDLDWSNKSAFLRQAMPAYSRFRMLDENSNGRLTLEEWQAVFSRAAQGKDYLTPDDLRRALFAQPSRRPAPKPAEANTKGNSKAKAKSPPKKSNMPSAIMLIFGLIKGEIGSIFEGPRVGQQAPDFLLKTKDGNRPVALSQFRAQRPVVLIFGSFT